MAIYVNFEVKVEISEDSQEGKELGKSPPWRGKNNQQDSGGTFLQKIVAGATDVLIDLNGLSDGTLIAIKSDQELTIKKNSATGEAWTLKPLGVSALDGVFFMTTTGVTSLYVSNPGSLDAEVTFAFAGVA